MQSPVEVTDTRYDYDAIHDGVIVTVTKFVPASKLRERLQKPNGDPEIIAVCRRGDISTVKMLVETIGASCANREYLNAAALSGHLELFKYLKEKYNHTIRKQTIECAIASGSPALVAYIHDTLATPATQEYMSYAVGMAQFDVAEYYFHVHGLLPTADDMDWLAGRYGDTNAFKLFYDAYGVEPTSTCI